MCHPSGLSSIPSMMTGLIECPGVRICYRFQHSRETKWDRSDWTRFDVISGVSVPASRCNLIY